MHQGKLSARFLFSASLMEMALPAKSFAVGLTLAVIHQAPSACTSLLGMPDFRNPCTRPATSSSVIRKPSKPPVCLLRFCWWDPSPPASLLQSSSVQLCIHSMEKSRWHGFLHPSVGLHPRRAGLPSPFQHCIYHQDYFLLVYYKGVKNAFKNPGLGAVMSQLSTLIYVY